MGFWFYGLGFGLRNNGDLWGKVFFLGFRLGILGIWFYGVLGLGFWAEILGLGFWAWDFGLRFWAKDFGNMVSGFFGLIFGIWV